MSISHRYVTFSTLKYFSRLYSFVWCLMSTGRNLGSFPSQVMISEVPKYGVIITLYSTYSSKIVVTFEPIVQFGCPLRFRIYNKLEILSILWLKAGWFHVKSLRKKLPIFFGFLTWKVKSIGYFRIENCRFFVFLCCCDFWPVYWFF